MLNTAKDSLVLFKLREHLKEGAPLTSDFLKGAARALQRDSEETLSLTQALNNASRAFGYASWNAAKAVLPAECDRPLGCIGNAPTFVAKIIHPDAVRAVLGEAAKHRHIDVMFVITRGADFLLPPDTPETTLIVVKDTVRDAPGKPDFPEGAALWQAFRADADLIVFPDAEGISEACWEALSHGSMSGCRLLLGHRGIPHPRGFVRVGISPDGAAYMPI